MWIARDKSGEVYLFTKNKPVKKYGAWWDETNNDTNDGIYIGFGDSVFPEVSYSDDEPTEVEIVIKKK